MNVDFEGITAIITGILIFILGTSWYNTRENIYLTLAIFMLFYITLDVESAGYMIRAIPILAYSITCLFIGYHDSSHFSKLSELIDQDNNQTLEEKLMDPEVGSAYMPIKVFAIDFVMLVVGGLIIWSIYLDKSNNGNYLMYKTYIQYALIGGSLSVAGLTIGLSLPALDTIITEQTTDG